ncbi:MAG TPA: DUF3179 domain-containing (seleno)protein [Thermoanaerobaculia bacterium]|nr:DUF3179 domain-containing (seleno)protein [Thermoanaerobaculia bacterium]
MGRARGVPVAAVSILLAATGCFAHRFRSSPRVGIVGGDPIVEMAPAHRFPSIPRANMVPLAHLYREKLDADDRVLGLALGGEARAYPLGLLDRFEVVNDQVAGRPVVAVRCALTEVASVWDRRVDGRALLFEGTGALWRDTLVFRDRETRTYWSAATGAGISGPLAGRRLTGIPAVVTRGDRWEEAHPESLYLEVGLGTEASTPLKLKLYRISPMQGVSGEKTSDRRHKPKEVLLAFEAGDQALAFTPREIEERGSVETTFAGQAVRIEWDPTVAAPRLIAADGGERPLLTMYWFALGRHFGRVVTLSETIGRSARARSPEA